MIFIGAIVLDWKVRRLIGTVVSWLCISLNWLITLLRSDAAVGGCAGGRMELQSCLQVVSEF